MSQFPPLQILVSDCPACGASIFVKYGNDETKVRCLRCRATPISLSLIQAITNCVGQVRGISVYEASSRGPVLNFLQKNGAKVTVSEYFPDVALGQYKKGVQCQDIQALTFDHESFDLSTSTEVFEHVGDDRKAFREMLRILRPGGTLAFTVPITGLSRTVERARLENGETVHLLPPTYHGDRLTGTQSVLVFRDYGLDIVERILDAGFSSVKLTNGEQRWFGFSRRVVVAQK